MFFVLDSNIKVFVNLINVIFKKKTKINYKLIFIKGFKKLRMTHDSLWSLIITFRLKELKLCSFIIKLFEKQQKIFFAIKVN